MNIISMRVLILTLKACLWFIMSYQGAHIKQLFWQGNRNCFTFWQKQFSPTEHEASWLGVLLLPSSVPCLSWKAVFGGEHVKESVSKAVVLICNIFFPYPYISENNNNNNKKITLAHHKFKNQKEMQVLGCFEVKILPATTSYGRRGGLKTSHIQR